MRILIITVFFHHIFVEIYFNTIKKKTRKTKQIKGNKQHSNNQEEFGLYRAFS